MSNSIDLFSHVQLLQKLRIEVLECCAKSQLMHQVFKDGEKVLPSLLKAVDGAPGSKIELGLALQGLLYPVWQKDLEPGEIQLLVEYYRTQLELIEAVYLNLYTAAQ